VPCTSEFDTSFSLTPNFSWVFVNQGRRHRFNGLPLRGRGETDRRPAKHPLKRGVNEKTTHHGNLNEPLPTP
jgi:hypothetical protein